MGIYNKKKIFSLVVTFLSLLFYTGTKFYFKNICNYLDSLVLSPAVPANCCLALSRELVAGSVNRLVVLPADKDLVPLVHRLQEAPLDRLLLDLLLGCDGHPVQAVLPESASTRQAHLRQLVQEREGRKQIVEEDVTSR